MKARRLDSFLFWTLFFLLLDQISKELVLRLNFWVDKTPGYFFSFFPSPFYYYLAVVLFFAFSLYKVTRRFLAGLEFFSLALISGGVWGNAFDNFYRQTPIDFLDLRWFLTSWPADLSSHFNLADVLIVTGLILYAVSFINHQSR